jgi:hypothetical protein
MNDQHDDDMAIITLDLPASLAAELEDLRRHFGDELVADLVLKAHATVKGKLALRGLRLDKNQK